MQMLQSLRQLWRTPSPVEVASRQLAETRLAILTAEADAERAAYTVELLKERATRLESYVAKEAVA